MEGGTLKNFLVCFVPKQFKFSLFRIILFITSAVDAGEVIRIFRFIVSTSPQKGDGACVGNSFCLKTKISLIIKSGKGN